MLCFAFGFEFCYVVEDLFLSFVDDLKIWIEEELGQRD